MHAASPMTEDVREFLTRRPRIAKVATKRKNGDPWVQPVWFGVDGDQLVFVISARSLLGRSILRERRLAVCVDDTEVPYAFAVVEGTVEVCDDADEANRWMETFLRQYRTDVSNPASHAQMLLTEYGFTMIRVSVDKIYYEPKVAPDPAD